MNQEFQIKSLLLIACFCSIGCLIALSFLIKSPIFFIAGIIGYVGVIGMGLHEFVQRWL